MEGGTHYIAFCDRLMSRCSLSLCLAFVAFALAINGACASDCGDGVCNEVETAENCPADCCGTVNGSPCAADSNDDECCMERTCCCDSLTATSAGSWFNSNAFPLPRASTVGVTVGERFYVIGGRRTNGRNDKDVDVFDLASNTWSKGEPMPTPRYFAGGAAVDAIIYVVNGHGGGNGVLRFDTVSGEWLSDGAAPPQTSISNPCAVSHGQYVYMMGGLLTISSSPTTYRSLSSVYRYDTTADKWKQLEDMSMDTSSAMCGVIDGKIYVAGGERFHNSSSQSWSKVLQVYSIERNEWETHKEMPSARARGEGVVVEGIGESDSQVFVVIAGQNGNSMLSSVYAYSPERDEWCTDCFPSLPTVLKSFAAGVSGSSVVVASGTTTSPFNGHFYSGTLVLLQPLACVVNGVQRVSESLSDETIVIGEVMGEVDRFLGIPYAHFTGRWRHSKLMTASDYESIVDGTNVPLACPQQAKNYWFEDTASFSDDDMAEDCMWVNIHRPHGVVDPLPVVVWIHGGGFAIGSPIQATNDPSELALRANVIVASISYRVGPLGALVVEEEADQPGGTGTYGLIDQRNALHWIRKFISRFSGDSSAITLYGESAGGTSVCLHMMLNDPSAPALPIDDDEDDNTTLFHRGIISSAACGRPQLVLHDQAMENVEAVFEAAKCSSGDIDCARAAPVRRIISYRYSKTQARYYDPSDLSVWYPFASPEVFPSDALPLKEDYRAYWRDTHVMENIPLLMVVSIDEAGFMFGKGPNPYSEQMLSCVDSSRDVSCMVRNVKFSDCFKEKDCKISFAQMLSKQEQQALDFAVEWTPQAVEDIRDNSVLKHQKFDYALGRTLSSCTWLVCPVLLDAIRFADKHYNVFLSALVHRPDVLEPVFGASHGADLAFSMGNVPWWVWMNLGDGFTDDEKNLAFSMMEGIGNFARGDPSVGGVSLPLANEGWHAWATGPDEEWGYASQKNVCQTLLQKGFLNTDNAISPMLNTSNFVSRSQCREFNVTDVCLTDENLSDRRCAFQIYQPLLKQKGYDLYVEAQVSLISEPCIEAEFLVSLIDFATGQQYEQVEVGPLDCSESATGSPASLAHTFGTVEGDREYLIQFEFLSNSSSISENVGISAMPTLIVCSDPYAKSSDHSEWWEQALKISAIVIAGLLALGIVILTVGLVVVWRKHRKNGSKDGEADERTNLNIASGINQT